MSPNGRTPTPREAERVAPEEAGELKPTPLPEEAEGEGPGTGAPAEFDWEAELDKLPPEKRWEFLVQMEAQAKSLLSMSEDERKAVIATQKEEREKLEAQMELLNLNPEERQVRIGEAKKRVEEISGEMVKVRQEVGGYFVTIRAEAERRRRAAEAEELKELMTENSDELIDLFVNALEEKNSARCAAILRKLTADTNENELLNYLGYPSNAEGLHRFTAEVLIGRELIKKPDGEFELGPKVTKIPGTDWKPLGLEPQTAYAIENDLSYIAEEKNHWGIARTVGQRFGQFYQASEEEQAGAVVAETAKFNAQVVARQFNRLAYGGEIPRRAFDPDAGRDFQIGRAGLAVLINLGGVMEGYMGKGEFNANAARNFWGIKDILRDAGVRPTFLKNLETYMEAKVEPDLAGVIRRAMAANIPSAEKRRTIANA